MRAKPKASAKKKSRTTARKRGSEAAAIFNCEGYKIPRNTVYEWKETHILGKPVPAEVALWVRDGGWRPVPAKHHVGKPVSFGGFRLMQRSKALNDEAIAEFYELARKQLGLVHDDTYKPMDERSHVMTDYGWVPLALWREMEGLREKAETIWRFFRQPEENG